MVLRQPTPPSNPVPAPLSHATNNPPYPITPSTEHPPDISSSSVQQDVYSPDLTRSPAFNLRPLHSIDGAQASKKDDEDESDYSDDSDWDKSDDEDTPDDLPDPLKIGGGKSIPVSANQNSLPDVLKAGPPPGVAIRKSLEQISPEPTGATAASWGGVSNSSAGSIPLQTNNPYLRIQHTGQSNFGNESSQSVWGDAPHQAQTYGELVELPSFQTPDTPTNHISNLTLQSNVPPSTGPTGLKSPDQPPLIAVESPTPAQTPASAGGPRHDSNDPNPWGPGMDASSLDAFSRSYGLPEDSNHQAPQRTWQEQQAWEQNEKERKQNEMSFGHEGAVMADHERRHEEGFHRVEQAIQYTPASSPPDEEAPPALPPRRSQEEALPPAMPPRPIDTGVGGPSEAGIESPNTVMNKQRKEHYQIKHIRWFDAEIRQIRSSPILTQNINGPCPLLALVNALVLSTPAGIKTEFVETLRTREQVSLGLLIDAVFEELMSGRRGGAAQELPDVNELYKFLVGLQTGLNVNPMFVQDPEATDGLSTLSSFSTQLGGFENTRDMRLYKTFNVPLLHGWLPEPGSDAYRAFERVAKSYESAQIVQFQLEELEQKLQSDGLNAEEQQMFTDIYAIKEFLERWPTQLTDDGLRNMKDSIKPGQFGILFRNDHFSTLYKNPHTNELMTLVTDQGYSTHDEIVWESLVDVNGQGSELYSGDFRAVGNNSLPQRQEQQAPVQSLLDIDNNQGWTTVPTRRRNYQAPSSSSPGPAQTTEEPGAHPSLTQAEQEDHDLALALQLQEEENDAHQRQTEERRRRENQLSENAIASQSQSRPGNRRTPAAGQNPPLIPPRRNNVQTHRPATESAPPPTYEEAATSQPYHPPQGHPANPQAPFQPGPPGLQGSAYQANTSGLPPGHGGRRHSSRPMGMPQPLPARLGRRQSHGVVGPNGPEEREKCIVM